MVVPDRVVEAERAVALAPRVAGALILLHDNSRDLELLEPRREGDGALPAADDEDVRLVLRVVAERRLVVLLLLEPGQAPLLRAVRDALRPRAVRVVLLLVAAELLEGGEERPALALLQADVALAAPDRRLEGEPAVGDAVRGVDVALELEADPRPALAAGALGGVAEGLGDRLRPVEGGCGRATGLLTSSSTCTAPPIGFYTHASGSGAATAKK